jgi:hypothetical protein
MTRPSLVFALLLALFFLSSCGYQFGRGSLPSQYCSMTVPYVDGDFDGSLTAAIAKQIVQSGAFEYRREGGDLLLKVKLVDLSDENIGFRYDRKKKGEIKHSIIPTETRIIALAEIKVEDANTGSILLGPVCLSASVDFDHDYYSSQNGVNIFSLGQLSDVDAAYDAVQYPLHQVLAKKIIDYVSDSW